ncbi:MAG: PTS lactose/cellobiose transporter subunit IIA [Ruminococcus sp.]
MVNIEEICFEIITNVGSAKSCFIEAIGLAKQGKFDEAHAQIKDGEKFFADGHHFHADLIAQEMSGDPVPTSMLLMHTEDQLMNADTAHIYALEFIELYEKLAAHNILD